jgi:hypothetical protein
MGYAVGLMKGHKKTAGGAGGFWSFGTLCSGTFRTLYRRGAGEIKVAKVKLDRNHG